MSDIVINACGNQFMFFFRSIVVLQFFARVLLATIAISKPAIANAILIICISNGKEAVGIKK